MIFQVIRHLGVAGGKSICRGDPLCCAQEQGPRPGQSRRLLSPLLSGPLPPFAIQREFPRDHHTQSLSLWAKPRTAWITQRKSIVQGWGQPITLLILSFVSFQRDEMERDMPGCHLISQMFRMKGSWAGEVRGQHSTWVSPWVAGPQVLGPPPVLSSAHRSRQLEFRAEPGL